MIMRMMSRTGQCAQPWRWPAGRALAGGLLGVALLAAATGCGSSAPAPAASAGTGAADLGSLHIRDAYIPQQTSDDEAAAYFTVTNDGGTPDELVSESTTAAMSVTLHATVDSGSVGTMVAMGTLTIPAHGTATLTPGHEHLLIMQPAKKLTKGQTVVLTLTFKDAGSISLSVPVTGLTGP
jgi:copper(I)-binding protein